MSSTVRSVEPATGALLWEGPASEIAEELDAVASGCAGWSSLPLTSRIEVLRRFANSVRANEEAFADLIARETGRPLWDAKAEVHVMSQQVDLAVSALSERAGQRRLEGAKGARMALRHRPHGIMAIIGPSSFSARIPSEQIVASLLAGNAVVFKPSEHASVVGQCLVDLLHGAGVPQEVLRCTVGGPDSALQLVLDDRVNGVMFTGRTQNGIAISRALAGRPDKLLSLNLSGNNPIIAWDVLDKPSAAALIVQSAFAHAGQHCLSARRLIVKEDIADDVIAEVRTLAERLRLDHPHAEDAAYMGPLIHMDAADDLTDSFLYLMSNGGKPILHMKRPFTGLPYVTPGIVDVTEMVNRPDVEYFGPLLQVLRARTFEDAVVLANETRFGLAAALIGGEPEQYDYFWANSRTGIVNWNRPTTAVPMSAPVGGTGMSGNHRAGGAYVPDHCAYPVVSSAQDVPRAAIGIGLTQPVPLSPRADAA